MTVPAGTVFGHLTVIEEVERSGYNRRFRCRCACGTETMKFLGNMRSGRSTSCGCTYEYGAAGRAQALADRHERAQITEHGRVCLTCQRWLRWDKFARDDRHSTGRMSNCLDCAHWRTIKTQYGITRQEWAWLMTSQGNRCALCDEYCYRNLSVDHDHECCGPDQACKDCIRGGLCDICNRTIGLVELKPLLRRRFGDYLKRRPFRSIPAGAAQTVLEDVPAPVD